MTIEEAIKKAIEGGWGRGYIYNLKEGDAVYFSQPHSREEMQKWKDEYRPNAEIVLYQMTGEIQDAAFLDPLFWQSLGKAMGWGTDLWVGKMMRLQGVKLLEMKWEIPDWQHHWHLFIDHLAEGKTAEDYFKSL